jgi:hypothetical protein
MANFVPGKAKFGIILKNLKNQQVVTSIIVKTQKKDCWDETHVFNKISNGYDLPEESGKGWECTDSTLIKMDTDS